MAENKDINFLSAYLVVGDDKLKQQRVEKRLEKRLSEFGNMSFNTKVFDAANASSGEEIVVACNTVPFASKYRLVKVRNAENLKKPCSEAIISYLEEPNETSILLLFATKLAKNTRLYKAVAGIGKTAVITCQTPKKENELTAIVRDMSLSHGAAITPDAARVLVNLVGENTVKLNAELEKLAIAHTSANPISKQEVVAQVARTAKVKWWDFVDAFSQRNEKKCLLLLAQMKNESPYSLLPLTTSRIRELIKVKALIKCSNSKIRAELKLTERMDWKVNYYKKWARNYTAKELREAIISARDAEANMKSGTNPSDAFYDWVIGVLKK